MVSAALSIPVGVALLAIGLRLYSTRRGGSSLTANLYGNRWPKLAVAQRSMTAALCLAFGVLLVVSGAVRLALRLL